MNLATSHDARPMNPIRFPPPAAAGFQTLRLIARASAAAESFWRQRPRGRTAAGWAAVAVALALAIAFGPSLMPPAVPTLVGMAADGEVQIRLHRTPGAVGAAAAPRQMAQGSPAPG